MGGVFRLYIYFNFLSFVGTDYKSINPSYANTVDVLSEPSNKAPCELTEILSLLLMRVKTNNGKVIFRLVYY